MQIPSVWHHRSGERKEACWACFDHCYPPVCENIPKIEPSHNDNLTKSQINHLLEYSADARLLIINADDFGMCNSINDAIFLPDSFTLDPILKAARYAQLLRELPSGLSKWVVHPGLDNSELLALEPDRNHVRQTDFDFWTSQQAKDVAREEGIILLDY